MIFIGILRKLKSKFRQSKYGWFGDYKSWEIARSNCSGYDDDLIIEKAYESILKIKNGLALYERDTVLFDKIELSFPVLSSLYAISLKLNREINLIDFGGSYGTAYFQYADFLKDANVKIQWNIIEQEKIVKIGKSELETDKLKFFYSFEEYNSINVDKDTVVFLSGVLQYLEKPYEFLNYLVSFNFSYLLFDRTSFTLSGKDRLTVQKVHPSIYKASYPAWFFSKDKFFKILDQKYDLVYEFDSYVKGEDVLLIDNIIAGTDKGFFFKLRC